jgi:hypothetical protein
MMASSGGVYQRMDRGKCWKEAMKGTARIGERRWKKPKTAPPAEVGNGIMI